MKRISRLSLFVAVATALLAMPADARSGRAGVARSQSRGSVSASRNVNRNVNVNVNRDIDVHGGYRGGYYGGCCYHPVATAAAVTATAVVTAAVVGSVVNTLPAQCSSVVINGFAYQQCGNTWYQPQLSGGATTYVVVNPPR